MLFLLLPLLLYTIYDKNYYFIFCQLAAIQIIHLMLVYSSVGSLFIVLNEINSIF